jgi:tetratricopeptide (TPR) repeat protein
MSGRHLLRCLCCVVLLGSQLMIAADEPDSAFSRAAAAYTAGAFTEAQSSLTALLEHDPDNATAWHALGLVMARQGRYGDAVLALRRSLRHEPNRAAAQQALDWVRAQLGSDPSSFDSPPLALHRFTARWPLRSLAIGAVSLALAATVWMVWNFSRRRPTTRPLQAALLSVVLALPASVERLTRSAHDGVVVLAPQLELRAGPAADQPSLMTLPAGTEAQLLETRDRWVRVGLYTGGSGWASCEALEAIRPDRKVCRDAR